MKHALIRIFGLLMLFCLTGSGLFAQDLIHKKGGEIVQARVIELGVDEIKYRLFDQPDGPIYVVEKESIVKIIFQNGHAEFYGTARIDATELFAGQRDKNVKVSFLGPLLGYTNILYEQNLKPGRSWEVKASIVGLGRRFDDHARGFIGSFAYKFYKKPTFYTSDMRRTHLLQGSYIKPEIFMGRMTYEEIDYDYLHGSTQNIQQYHVRSAAQYRQTMGVRRRLRARSFGGHWLWLGQQPPLDLCIRRDRTGRDHRV